MIPQDQTTFGFPGGNCFSACIASLLELPIADVPQFMNDDPEDTTWNERLAAWLKPRGYYTLCFVLEDNGRAWVPPGLHILSGLSPRTAGLHSVVAHAREIVHDPHPSREGLRSRKDVILLIPFDPAHVPAHVLSA